MEILLRNERNSQDRGRCSPLSTVGEPMFLQLQQSGLPQKLPPLLSAGAAELNKAMGLTDAERQQLLGRGRESADQKVSPRVTADQLLDLIMMLKMVQFHVSPTGDHMGGALRAAGMGLGMGRQLVATSVRPLDADTTETFSEHGMSVSGAVAMMEFVLAVARDFSRGVAKLRPGATPDPDELASLMKAFNQVELLCANSLTDVLTSNAAVTTGSAPGLDQVMLSDAMLPCLSLVLAFAMYSQAAKQQRKNATAAARSASFSRSSSSSSRGSVGLMYQLITPAVGSAWKQANKTLPTLPDSHQKLCAALGLDIRMLPTLAAMDTSAMLSCMVLGLQQQTLCQLCMAGLCLCGRIGIKVLIAFRSRKQPTSSSSSQSQTNLLHAAAQQHKYHILTLTKQRILPTSNLQQIKLAAQMSIISTLILDSYYTTPPALTPFSADPP